MKKYYNTLEKLTLLLPKRDAASLPVVDKSYETENSFYLQTSARYTMYNKTEILQEHEERKKICLLSYAPSKYLFLGPAVPETQFGIPAFPRRKRYLKAGG